MTTLTLPKICKLCRRSIAEGDAHQIPSGGYIHRACGLASWQRELDRSHTKRKERR